MVSIGAIIFRSPRSTAVIVKISVKIVPIRGRFSLPLPFPSRAMERGKTPSRARACNTRGAAIVLPRALDRVAPQTPIRMASPQNAILRMIMGSSTRLIASARVARIIGNTIYTT